MQYLNPKFEYRNSKQFLNSNFPMLQTYKFGIWNLKHWGLFRISDFGFRIFICFIFCLLLLTFVSKIYALNLDKVKIKFLGGDYKSAISEGEKVLTKYTAHSPHLDELYYFLGLSYLKDGNYLRASDIFEIILREFKDSPFQDEAKLGLGDTYFLKGDYNKAQGYYSELINSNPRTGLKAALYYRLSQIGFKIGDTQAAKEYLDKLKTDFSSSLEVKLNQDLYALTDIYYAVQAGSFVNFTNARNLCDKLISKGYDAYLQETDANNMKIYRVKVGRLKSRPDAAQLENKLSSEGYPTKIIP